ncbi:uncharacterized protein PV07_04167 [Cladophialophora immunda]|uniref:AMP-dependent synthetase/ligase domain-containing protein n=1 Tax=Cladophialophora immunda TaxID=569365 RepID=A0A0D2B4Z9_9EURO|nr:uncharacterized protein PV07_04167 [Cladophialophora immunda]KIW32637.1 hypothetical protein PV07_04167 [Cladophialophora immunda]
MQVSSPFPDIEIPECNILSYLFPTIDPKQAQEDQSRPLWINASNPSIRLSVADTLLFIRRFAVGLERLQIPRQRAVMVLSPNHVYLPVVYLAAAGAGCFFSGASPAYTVEEVSRQLRMSDAALMLVHPSLLDCGVKAAEAAGLPLDRVFQFSDVDCNISKHGVRDWKSMLGSEEESRDWQWDPLRGERSRKTVSCVNFSSGTTGTPKGVRISHANVVANACQVIYAKAHNADQSLVTLHPERWLAFLPLNHAYAQLFSIVIVCKLRTPVFLMTQFRFNDYLRHIQTHKITTLQVVPPVISMLHKRPEVTQYDLGSVRYLMSAAAPLSSELQNAVTKQLKGAVIAQSWGMTETTCTGLMIPGTTPDDTGSVGSLLPNTQAMLVNEQGREVGGATGGELWIRGPQITAGYWRNAEATSQTLTEDGWLKTGDIAKYSGGKWWIVDRSKELIKVNGFQVAPAELEAVLLEHDDITDAAVVGIVLHGEEYPRAYVTLHQHASRKVDLTSAIQEFVSRKVAKHKALTGGVSIVDAIPRLQSGKIQRNVVKQWSKRDATELEKTVKARL